MPRVIVVFFFISLSFFTTIQATYPSVPNIVIRKQGVNYHTLNPIALSNDGSYFIATEITDNPQEKARGYACSLVVFRLAEDSLQGIEKIPLPIYEVVNAAYDPVKEFCIVVGNAGNKIIQVSLRNGKHRVLFSYKHKRPGFKGGNMLFCHLSKFYATGWFYDKDQYWKGDYLARLHLYKKKKKTRLKFVKEVDLEKLFIKRYEGIGKVRSYSYVAPNDFYFSLIKYKEKRMALMRYYKGKVTEIATGYFLTVFTANSNRIFYTKKDIDGKSTHFVRNLQNNKIWQIGKRQGHLTYPFMVQDRLVILKIDLEKKTFHAFYGDESQDYRLRRFLKGEKMGGIKISPNKKHFLLMSPDGIKWGNFK